MEHIRNVKHFIEIQLLEKHSNFDGPLLEIGCGRGKKTTWLGSFEQFKVVGVDVDAEEIQRAKHNITPYTQFICQDIFDMTDQYPGILLTEVLEHIPEPQAFLQQIYHLCKPGGFLILTTPNGYCLKELMMRGSTWIFPKRIRAWYRHQIGHDQIFNESPHVQWFTLRRLRKMLIDVGFSIEEAAAFNLWSEIRWTFFTWIKLPRQLKTIEQQITPYTPVWMREHWGVYAVKE